MLVAAYASDYFRFVLSLIVFIPPHMFSSIRAFLGFGLFVVVAIDRSPPAVVLGVAVVVLLALVLVMTVMVTVVVVGG